MRYLLEIIGLLSKVNAYSYIWNNLFVHTFLWCKNIKLAKESSRSVLLIFKTKIHFSLDLLLNRVDFLQNLCHHLNQFVAWYTSLFVFELDQQLRGCHGFAHQITTNIFLSDAIVTANTENVQNFSYMWETRQQLNVE